MQRFRAERTQSAEPESLDGADEVSRARRAPGAAYGPPMKPSAGKQWSRTTCDDSERSGRSPRSRNRWMEPTSLARSKGAGRRVRSAGEAPRGQAMESHDMQRFRAEDAVRRAGIVGWSRRSIARPKGAGCRIRPADEAQRGQAVESHDMQRFRAERTQSAEPESLDGADEVSRARRAPGAGGARPLERSENGRYWSRTSDFHRVKVAL